MIKKIGVLGGSFDPVHYGHLILAEQVRSAAGLDAVMLIPANISPFKLESEPAPGEDRLEMVKLAIEGRAGLLASDIEINRDGPSYTYDTLCSLEQRLGENSQLYFIAGADSLLSIEKWYRAGDLLAKFPVLIGKRSGMTESKEELEAKAKELGERFGADVRFLDIPELEISSSDIRMRFAEGRSVRFLLPDSVINYMNERRLYRDLPKLLEEFARSREKETRFAHTQGVVKTAIELAERYGADPYKAEVAAWAHDAFRPAGNLIHGDLAADALEMDFNVTDPEILDAVRYHTTGRPGMCLLEKVLKLADSLEPGRTYPGVEELRASLTDDINSSLHNMMAHTRDYVNSIGGTYVQISVDAIADLERLMESEKQDD